MRNILKELNFLKLVCKAKVFNGLSTIANSRAGKVVYHDRF